MDEFSDYMFFQSKTFCRREYSISTNAPNFLRVSHGCGVKTNTSRSIGSMQIHVHVHIHSERDRALQGLKIRLEQLNRPTSGSTNKLQLHL